MYFSVFVIAGKYNYEPTHFKLFIRNREKHERGKAQKKIEYFEFQ